MRRRLGMYDFGVAKDDFRRTVETVKNSQAYQKTTSAVKTAASKTSEVVSKQWTNVRFVVGVLLDKVLECYNSGCN
ncbi:unnamed protein product [Dibothriocephalus latus]|uniref:Uncharacterized protein n=1 Tax=Dibothriocephalus latus TaxID=60516 RepID=A0A3P7N6A9_DIBLA|nr:unnamed protein product [Dibothriocephalus latus]